jgi:hypothetical protein
MSTMGHATASPRGLVTGVRAAGWLPAFGAALSLSAAIAHFGVAAPHYRQWWAHGMFFFVCGALQALFAVLVFLRPRVWLILTGIAGTLAILAMYVYSRTNGSPIGPHEGVPEEPGVYDMTTAAGELVLIVVLVLMLGEGARRWAMRLVLLAGIGLWVAKATGVLV